MSANLMPRNHLVYLSKKVPQKNEKTAYDSNSERHRVMQGHGTCYVGGVLWCMFLNPSVAVEESGGD
jgi:hypothetical protein